MTDYENNPDLVKLLASCSSEQLERIQILASEEDPEKVELIRTLAYKSEDELDKIMSFLPA